MQHSPKFLAKFGITGPEPKPLHPDSRKATLKRIHTARTDEVLYRRKLQATTPDLNP